LLSDLEQTTTRLDSSTCCALTAADRDRSSPCACREFAEHAQPRSSIKATDNESMNPSKRTTIRLSLLVTLSSHSSLPHRDDRSSRRPRCVRVSRVCRRPAARYIRELQTEDARHQRQPDSRRAVQCVCLSSRCGPMLTMRFLVQPIHTGAGLNSVGLTSDATASPVGCKPVLHASCSTDTEADIAQPSRTARTRRSSSASSRTIST
jgi:hypothetical protein